MDVEIDAEGARVKPLSIRENPTSENPTSRTWAGSKGTQSLSHVNEIHPVSAQTTWFGVAPRVSDGSDSL